MALAFSKRSERLEHEPSAKRVADQIADAHEHDIPLFMSVVETRWRFGTSLPAKHR
jgi:hypothetical protein